MAIKIDEHLEAKLCRLRQMAGTHLAEGCVWCAHLEKQLPAVQAVMRREVIREVTRRAKELEAKPWVDVS